MTPGTSERNKRRLAKKAKAPALKVSPAPKVVSLTLANSTQHLIGPALATVVGQVDLCAVIDTGITDNTLEVAKAVAGDKLRVTRYTWSNNFAAARNAALEFARELGAEWALFVDTDERFDWKGIDLRSVLSALTQDAVLIGCVDGTYAKEKAFRVGAVRYVGDTHEAPIVRSNIRVPGPVFEETPKTPAEYQAKFHRDAAILMGMVSRPEFKDDGRWWLYLGMTHQSLCNYEQAARAFGRCVELRTGVSEEGAYAAYRQAECLTIQERHQEALEACARGLTRYAGSAELTWLAGVCCSRMGRAEEAATWARLAIMLGRYEGIHPRREGFLKLEAHYEDPYNLLQHTATDPALRESAAKKWSLAKRKRMGAETEEDLERLAVTHGNRHAWEMRRLLRPDCLGDLVSGVEVSTLEVDPVLARDVGIEGYKPLNPSTCMHKGELWICLRTVNYEIKNGQYVTIDPDGMVRTVNLLGKLGWVDGKPHMRGLRRMVDRDPGPRQPTRVLGYEDVRLFSVEGKLWGSATVRDRDNDRCQIALLDIDAKGDVAAAEVQAAQTAATEKNWMPIIGDSIRWMYSVHPSIVRRRDGHMTSQHCGLALDHVRGGSALVPFDDGYLCVTHETIHVDGWGCRRIYLHRFVRFDSDLRVVAVTPTWTFEPKNYGIEFCCSMSLHPSDKGKLVICYGVEDREAKIAVVPERGVAKMNWITTPEPGT